MDETDIALSLALLQNSRTPYRALATKFNLSVNAIHKRIQAMIESGVIRGFTARPNLKVTRSLQAYVYGQARAEPLKSLPSALAKDDSVFWVAQAGGNHIYVGLYLRTLEDLWKLGEFIRKTADMPDPTIGLIGRESKSNVAPARGDELDVLDWQIIDQLRVDSRRQITDVSSNLSVSAKTVRRRLDHMIQNQLIDLSITWYPDASDDIISIFHAKLGSSKKLDFDDIYRKLGRNLLFPLTFINMPNENLLFTWTRTMKELKEVKGKIESDPNYSNVSMNILFTGDIFPTWRDELPYQMGYPDQPTA